MSPEPTFERRLEVAHQILDILHEANPQIETHHLDQVAAASKQAHRTVLELPGKGWQVLSEEERGPVPPEVAARIFVAMVELTRCVHLTREGPQPGWARLSVGRLDCARCAKTVRRPIAEARCDWCDRRGVAQLSRVAIQSGPGIVFGRACVDCAGALRWYEEVAS